VHGTGVYSVGVGPKGPALERFLGIKKKYIYNLVKTSFVFMVKKSASEENGGTLNYIIFNHN
jgi:hypothetical protein